MKITLGEVMTADVKTLRADQVLLEAMTFLRDEGFRHIPVVRDGKLVGIVTDRDIKRATPTAMLSSQRDVWESIVNETPLERVMTWDPTTASTETTLREGLQIFLEQKVGCLPITTDGELVGIVTAQDLFQAMLKVLDG